jgi:hypothetical protein
VSAETQDRLRLAIVPDRLLGRRLADEADAGRADGDLIAALEPRRGEHARAVVERPVRAAEIAHDPAVLVGAHDRLAPRCRRIVERDVVGRAAPDRGDPRELDLERLRSVALDDEFGPLHRPDAGPSSRGRRV